jgi:hypothetical protein
MKPTPYLVGGSGGDHAKERGFVISFVPLNGEHVFTVLKEF